MIFSASNSASLVLMPYFFLMFTIGFIGKEQRLHHVLTYVLSSLYIFGMIFLSWKTSLVIDNVYEQTASGEILRISNRAPFSGVLSASISGVFTVSLLLLIIAFFNAKESIRKKQLQYVVIAVLIPFMASQVYYRLFAPAGINLENALNPILNTLMSLVIVFAILKYRLFNVPNDILANNLIATIPNALFVVDAEKKIKQINHAALVLLGYKENQIINKNFDDLIELEDGKKYSNIDMVNGECLLVPAKNTKIPGSLNVKTIKNDEHELIGAIIIFTDLSSLHQKSHELEQKIREIKLKNKTLLDAKIYEEKLLEEEKSLEQFLKKERDQANAIISSINDAVIVYDPDDRIILLNPIAEKLLEISLQDAKGMLLFDILGVYKNDKKLAFEERPGIRTLNLGIDIDIDINDNIYYESCSGRRFPVSGRTSSLKNDEGTLIGAVMVIRDVTKEKEQQKVIQENVDQAISKLKEQEIKLQTSINSLSIGFLLMEKNLRVVTVNDFAFHLFNQDDEFKTREAIQNKFLEKISHRFFPSTVAIVDKVAEAGNLKTAVSIPEIEVNGKFFKLLINPIINYLHGSEVIGYVLLIEDITTSKQLEKSKDEFFSIASHELRTPLTVISGNLALIKEHYADEIHNPDFLESINDIQESSTRLINIVNDFLDVSRLEQGRMVYKKEDFDFIDLSKSVVKELTPLADAKKITLSLNVHTHKKIGILSDKSKVQQILINLVSNAIKFTEVGGITVGINLKEQTLEVTVSDTGVGISEKNQSLLFRKFQQANTNILTRSPIKGTGLGLYISRKMASDLGGSLELKNSTPGKGSTFSLSLPLD